MESFFQQVEASGLSVWIRESDSLLAFPGILILHTLGMAFFAGTTAAISLIRLKSVRSIRADAVLRLFPVAWTGLAVNVLSGVLLVVAYPTKALTNPVFYIKLLCIGLMIGALQVARRQLRSDSLSIGAEGNVRAKSNAVAIAMLLLAMLTIVSGRLLPYTYAHLMAFH
jgi:hypothetical protein